MREVDLRDWFAGCALDGMLASETQGDGLCPPRPKEDTWESTVAKQAYEYADAMMEARKPETTEEASK